MMTMQAAKASPLLPDNWRQRSNHQSVVGDDCKSMCSTTFREITSASSWNTTNAPTRSEGRSADPADGDISWRYRSQQQHRHQQQQQARRKSALGRHGYFMAQKSTCYQDQGQYPALSQNMSLSELSRFRTQTCPRKVATDRCDLNETCPYSHCISWYRRNPFTHGYRPQLCPNVIFRTENGKMKVKNHCKRGRACLYSHTKEEQMYHPIVYKSQLCRDWPSCAKFFCPFAHGLLELRNPDRIPFVPLEGPERPEKEISLSSFGSFGIDTARRSPLIDVEEGVGLSGAICRSPYDDPEKSSSGLKSRTKVHQIISDCKVAMGAEEQQSFGGRSKIHLLAAVLESYRRTLGKEERPQHEKGAAGLFRAEFRVIDDRGCEIAGLELPDLTSELLDAGVGNLFAFHPTASGKGWDLTPKQATSPVADEERSWKMETTAAAFSGDSQFLIFDLPSRHEPPSGQNRKHGVDAAIISKTPSIAADFDSNEKLWQKLLPPQLFSQLSVPADRMSTEIPLSLTQGPSATLMSSPLPENCNSPIAEGCCTTSLESQAALEMLLSACWGTEALDDVLAAIGGTITDTGSAVVAQSNSPSKDRDIISSLVGEALSSTESEPPRLVVRGGPKKVSASVESSSDNLTCGEKLRNTPTVEESTVWGTPTTAADTGLGAVSRETPTDGSVPSTTSSEVKKGRLEERMTTPEGSPAKEGLLTPIAMRDSADKEVQRVKA